MRNTKLKTMLALGVAPAIISSSFDNTGLTPLIGQLYAGLDVVSREIVGFIPSVNRDTGVERAAVGQSVTYYVAPEMTATDTTPSMNTPEPTDRDLGNGQITITKSRGVDFGFVGEEQQSLSNGVGNMTVQAGLFAQGLRTLVNEIETDLAVEMTRNASRATGTAGTTPYASGVGDSAQLSKILKDNGAPMGELSQVLGTTAGAAFQTNTQLTKVNEAGDQMNLRQGEFGQLHKFSIKESGQSVEHTSSATSVNTDGSAYAVGDTLITMAASGHIPGDVISFAGDPNLYVVSLAAGAAITIAKPGLMQAIPAVATAVTTSADYEANVGFSRTAGHLVMRAPAKPKEGDDRLDELMMVDPRSGLVFEVTLWGGYRKIRAEVAAAWGVHNSKSEHTALLLG